jgi:TDG/mug DNA glycosylase family protein
MTVAGLADILQPNLRVVFCGTAVAEKSAARGHYYAGSGNIFWALLRDAGFTRDLLTPEDDQRLPGFGIGLTDLAKNIVQSHDRGLKYDVRELGNKLIEFEPDWIAFTSKEAGKAVAHHLGKPAPGLGPQTWTFGPCQVFVVPSSSGANRGGPWDGRDSRLSWWAELASLAMPPGSV